MWLVNCLLNLDVIGRDLIFWFVLIHLPQNKMQRLQIMPK